MTNAGTTDRITTVDPRTPLTGWQWFRLVGNIVNLTTPVGLLVAAIGGARVRRGPAVCSSARATGRSSRWPAHSPSAA